MYSAELFDDKAMIVASHPGYLRLKIPALYRSERERRRIESALSRHPHIAAVHANVLTAKILVLYDARLTPDGIFALLKIPPCRQDATAPAPSRPAAPIKTRRLRTAPVPMRREGEAYPQWHLQPQENAVDFHCTDRRFGLSSDEAKTRLQAGRNVLPRKQPQSAMEAFLGQLKGLPVLLLGASAVLSMLTGGIAEAIAIASVLAMNAYIGFVTERRAEATIASLSELVDDTAPVLRDGTLQETPAAEVVPGDMLILMPGVHIAADARIVEARDLATDESALTGESHFVSKNVAALSMDSRLSIPLAERLNMVYAGTAVAAGNGLAVVVGTGPNTEIGHIESMMATVEQPQTPIQKQLDNLGNRLVTISLAVCAAVFFIGLLRGQRLLQMIKSAISLAIAAVPEGLPTVATTSLARGLLSMRERQMLIRRLQAVETLGAVQTICFDKTGTLTLNRMSAVMVCTMSGCHAAENGNPLWEDERPSGPLATDLKRLLDICVLSNEYGFNGNGASAFSGSATENALVRLAVAAGISIGRLRDAHPLLHVELRANKRNYMTTVHAVAGTVRQLVAVKGSPIDVLGLCSHVQSGDELVPITERLRTDIAVQNARMAEQQLRVLGFAYAEQAPTGSTALEARGLVWVGLVGLADPVRPSVAKVIEAFHRAGIRTSMITGDQKSTASAIGRCIGLAGSRMPNVLEPDQLDETDRKSLIRSVANADIFARVSPAQKLRIMQALQQTGRVIAMTGDGVNDGPALRAADVGIAMGQNGTNLARSAADVVLKDDRLETVLEAIAQGRAITRNIEKSLHFLISSNLSEILLTVGSVSIVGASPLSPMQLLWINLLSDVLPAIALAMEPADKDVMTKPPRDPARPLVGSGDLARYAREGALLSSGAFAAYAYGLVRYGPGPQASGIAFNSLVVGQLLHALSCRSPEPVLSLARRGVRNPKLGLAIGGSIALQGLANLIPGLRNLFALRGASLLDMAVALAGATLPFFANEAAKQRTHSVSDASEINAAGLRNASRSRSYPDGESLRRFP